MENWTVWSKAFIASSLFFSPDNQQWSAVFFSHIVRPTWRWVILWRNRTTVKIWAAGKVFWGFFCIRHVFKGHNPWVGCGKRTRMVSISILLFRSWTESYKIITCFGIIIYSIFRMLVLGAKHTENQSKEAPLKRGGLFFLLKRLFSYLLNLCSHPSLGNYNSKKQNSSQTMTTPKPPLSFTSSRFEHKSSNMALASWWRHSPIPNRDGQSFESVTPMSKKRAD